MSISNVRPGIITKYIVGSAKRPAQIWAHADGVSRFSKIDHRDPPVMQHFKAACLVCYERKEHGSLIPGRLGDDKMVWVWSDDAPTYYKVSQSLI